MTAHVPTPLGRRGEQLLERFGGDYDSVFFEGTWHTAGELAGRARRAARGFAGLGVRPGDRVVVLMANCPEVGITYSALWRAGALPTPVLFLVSDDELRHVVRDSGAVAVVTTPEFLPKVRSAAPGLHHVVVGGADSVVVGGGDRVVVGGADGVVVGGADAPGVVPFAALEAEEELPLVDRAADDLAALLYTGGTTGRAKGVALTHASLDAAGWAAQRASYRPGLSVMLLPLPLAHVYGLMVSVAGLHATERRRAVLMRWFDAAGFLRLVEEHGVQQSACVPSMLQLLLAQPLEEHDLSTWERVTSGGAPLAAEVAAELERRVPGLEVREGYGCTEASALVAAQPEVRRPGSVGRPVDGVEVRIDGAQAPGEDGEICVRGPVLMRGYWQDEAATDEAVRDGWLHTGDLGHLDEDGYLYVVDRLKDLVIRNGFNVYPRDVEDVLLAHPAVTAAAVVGRPDPVVGEEVVAFVSVSAPVEAAELVAWCRERVSAAKYPREVRVVDAIPLTSALKTDRKAVRRLL